MTDGTDFPALPQQPDSETGQPFPPHGRGWRGDDRKPEYDRNRETRLSHKPEPPKGKGPVLAWHKESKRGKISLFVTSVVFFVVAFTIIRALNGDQQPFEWVSYWQLWVVLIVGALLITRPMSFVVLSAGADWFQLHHVRFGVTTRRKYVNLYELRNITVTVGGAGALFLELADDSNDIYLARHEWQSDRRMWDLVYNGILHSVAAGAKVDGNARGMLELDHVRELRYPEGGRQIDVTQLSDVHVWQLMEDPMIRRLCKSIEFDGSAAEFRKLFPELREEMLENPANPAWFAAAEGSDSTSSEQDR
ncbi:MAG: hypothetical protein GEU98_02430 [Pseudonocardiaceae bacterium]|nr:hypothetical protein [Pseudonocardiaceae bacterium]